LIQRLPDQADRRGTKIMLTAAGLKIANRFLPHLIQLERNMGAGLTGNKAADPTRLLDKLFVATARAVMMRTQMPATSLWLWLWLAPEGATENRGGKCR
jgi:DNA-binding MarR family transcriptional regulator